jgi:peptide/nickel transport system ATP-binding protein
MLVAAVPRPGRRLIDGVPESAPVLALDRIGVTYGRPRLLGGGRVSAAQDVSLDVRAGEILGLVGESGSGKSSLARAVTGLAPFAGTLRFDGREIASPRAMDREYRRAVQIVFQHPDSSLNPRHRVRDILARPLRLFGFSTDLVTGLLEQVRLPAAFASRYPHQLSGGEKQRVAIARAFAVRPRLVVCDEITAPLDVSVQAAIVELLLELRRAHGTAYLFITHDLNLVRQIAHRLAVMQAGRLVDLLEPQDLARAAPYTRELIAATPTPVG